MPLHFSVKLKCLIRNYGKDLTAIHKTSYDHLKTIFMMVKNCD